MKARTSRIKKRVPGKLRGRRTLEARKKLAERIRAFRNTRAPSLSQILQAATAGQPARMSVGTLSERLSARGLAPLVLMMGVLNCFAVIPGTSTILGLPLVFLGISLVIGARRLWLPRRIRDHEFETDALRKAISKAVPYIRRIERFVRPRYWPGGEVLTYRIYGLIVLAAGVIVVLPIPFGNLLPSITVILLSIGFVERDGLWVLGGLLFGTAVVVVLSNLIVGAVHYAWRTAFS